MTTTPEGEPLQLPVPWQVVPNLETLETKADEVLAGDPMIVAGLRYDRLAVLERHGISVPRPMHAFGVIRSLANIAVTAEEATPPPSDPVSLQIAQEVLTDEAVLEVMTHRALVRLDDEGTSEDDIQAQYDPSPLRWDHLLRTAAGFVTALQGHARGQALLEKMRDQPIERVACADNRSEAATFATLAGALQIAQLGRQYVEQPGFAILGNKRAAELIRGLGLSMLLTESYRLLPPDKRAIIDGQV